MKNTFIAFFCTLIILTVQSASFAAVLYPYADGHIDRYYESMCLMGECEIIDSTTTGPGVRVRYSYGASSGMFYEYWWESSSTGVIEFNTSDIAGLFSEGVISTELILTVKSGSLEAGKCISVYDILDVYENGTIESADDSDANVIDVFCNPLAVGDTVVFNVTDAVAHDLLDQGQSAFTGFYIPPDSSSINIEFFYHTDPDYGPRLIVELIPIAYYPFSGNATDVSSNGHDADVNTAALAPDRFAFPNRAYHFDGTDDIIRIDNATAFNTEHVSVAAWVNPEIDPTPSDWPRIVDKYNWELKQGYSLLIVTSTGKARFSILAENGLEYYADTTTTVTPGQWHHLAGTFDGSTLRIYYNGQEEASVPVASPISHTDGTLSIGNVFSNGLYFPFAGTIDEVRIYGKALSPVLIEDLTIDGDSDSDGVPDETDNCPGTCNSNQLDADGDGVGDVCDYTPGCGGCGEAACEESCDADNDGISILIDNCPNTCNIQQLDADGDTIGDVCDEIPGCGGCGQPVCEQSCDEPCESVDRFLDNGDGTVTDCRTEFIWLQNANCYGKQAWSAAMASAAGLNSGECGLTDGSAEGDWHLATKEELQGIGTDPPITGYSGYPSVAWAMPGSPFFSVQSNAYESSTDSGIAPGTWVVVMGDGYTYNNGSELLSNYVWPVRSDN
jgi:hypothetical protein